MGRTLTAMSKELIEHPFFPLLFIAEAIKEIAVTMAITQPVVIYTILAVAATIIWVFSDVIEVRVNEEGSIVR